jgi:hypothetical protein
MMLGILFRLVKVVGVAGVVDVDGSVVTSGASRDGPTLGAKDDISRVQVQGRVELNLSFV